jgi:hypothetical protein
MSKAQLQAHQLNNCRNDLQRAILHVLAKESERLSNAEANIAPDVRHDVGGVTVKIHFPEGTSVRRGLGNQGNGTDKSKATQNLYGYAFWALLFRRLATLNQWNVVREHVIEAMEELLEMGKNDETLEDYLKRTANDETREKNIKTLEEDIEKLKARFPIPDRIQDTSRHITRPKGKPLPTVEIEIPKGKS